MMEKRYYSIESLEGELREFEERYGLRSDDFYRAYLDGTEPSHVETFDRVVWADLYRTLCRLRGASSRAALQPAG
jgi:hypothetical protein